MSSLHNLVCLWLHNCSTHFGTYFANTIFVAFFNKGTFENNFIEGMAPTNQQMDEIDVTNYDEQHQTVRPQHQQLVQVIESVTVDGNADPTIIPQTDGLMNETTTMVVQSQPRYNTLQHKRNHRSHREALVWLEAQVLTQTNAIQFTHSFAASHPTRIDSAN
jgi:hypothetical protein